MSRESLQKEDDLFARVKAQVMVRDDGKGGWVPLGQGGMSSVGLIRFSKTDCTNTTLDFCIQGWRLTDRSVILRCAIRRDLSYTKVNPTFHHWRTEGARYGLTFQTSSDAKTFEKNLKKALNLLKYGGNEKPSNFKLEKTQMHAKRLEKYESFSRANSTTSTTVSSPTLTSPTHYPPSPIHHIRPATHRLSSPTPPSSIPIHHHSSIHHPSSFYHGNSLSGHFQAQQQQQQILKDKTSTLKKPKTPVENLKSLLNVNIFHKSSNENTTNTTLPKPWCYFTFPPFNLKSKEDRQERYGRSSLPDNIKILTTNNNNKPLLLPPVLSLSKAMRHSVSGVECRQDEEKAPLKLLPSCHQLHPHSHNNNNNNGKRRFEIFGRMTSKLMTFSSISCPNESRCNEDTNKPTSVPIHDITKPPSSSLPAMAGWCVSEKKHPHYPSTLALPYPNFPPPFLLQPSSSSSSNKNYGTIFSESEFALRLTCENAARERCRFCNEEFSSTSNFSNSCQQAPDRVGLWIERLSCCWVARPLVHQCCSQGHQVEGSYKRQESYEGESSEEGGRREGCYAKWASMSALLCFSLAFPCLCLYWPLTFCHFAAARCGCCNLMSGGRHESV